jgi:hypothetical protein
MRLDGNRAESGLLPHGGHGGRGPHARCFGGVWRSLEQHEPMEAYSSEVEGEVGAGVAKTTCLTIVTRVAIGGRLFMRTP